MIKTIPIKHSCLGFVPWRKYLYAWIASPTILIVVSTTMVLFITHITRLICSKSITYPQVNFTACIKMYSILTYIIYKHTMRLRTRCRICGSRINLLVMYNNLRAMFCKECRTSSDGKAIDDICGKSYDSVYKRNLPRAIKKFYK
jgi:hypothetical protein